MEGLFGFYIYTKCIYRYDNKENINLILILFTAKISKLIFHFDNALILFPKL